jgi:hypothetical protein
MVDILTLVKPLVLLYNFCKGHGIINQCTMFGFPQPNSVAKRINRTLMDMVRNMLVNTNLPTFLWTRALKQPFIYSIRFHQNLSLKLLMRSGHVGNRV